MQRNKLWKWYAIHRKLMTLLCFRNYYEKRPSRVSACRMQPPKRMNPRDYTQEIPATFAENAELVDIARDNLDLKGDFPPNVVIRYLYIAHGNHSIEANTPEIALAVYNRWARLSRWLLDADGIGVELARTNMPMSYLNRLFRRANTFSEQLRQGADIDPTKFNSTFELALFSMAHGIHQLRPDKNARFFPVDQYATSLPGMATTPSETAGPQNHNLGLLIQDAKDSRQRESLVL